MNYFKIRKFLSSLPVSPSYTHDAATGPDTDGREG